MKLFAGFGNRHVYLALGFCIVVQVAHSTYALLGKEDLRPGSLLAWTVLFFFLALIGLACAVAVDNLLGESARTATRVALAMLVAALATTATVELLLLVVPQSLAQLIEEKEKAPFLNDFHRILFRFSVSAGWALLLVALYTMIQASRRASDRLHQMQLAALAAERGMLEADLRATQGRVDPELLFDSLLEVDRAYERSVEAGQEALDALIRFLRAALPSDAAATATVAGEQELAEAYLALVAHRTEPGPHVDISVTPEARTLPMPAMLLLPLVRWALDSATQLEIHAQRRDADLEVSVRSNSSASASSAEPNIAGVRERLARLFAGAASLDVSVSADARHARLLIPAS